MNMTTVPSNQLKAMQHEIAEKDVEIAALKAATVASLKQSEAYWESQYNQISFVLDSTERDKEALEETIELLKEQVAHIKEIEFPTKCIAIANIWKNKVTLLDETIAQQAEAIRLKNAALTVAEDFVDRHSEKWYASGQRDLQQIREAMLIQPSPEILQARDKRVAEACAKVCIEQSEGIARSTPVSRDRLPTLAENTMFKGIARAAPVRDCSESSVRESAFRIRNGAWERHL